MYKLLAAASVVAVLASCAGQPSTSDILNGQADSLQKKVDLKRSLAKDLEKGKKLIEEGKERAEDGKKSLEKGNQQIADGSKMIENAKKIYSEQFPGEELKF